jgi:hypothetical protein
MLQSLSMALLPLLLVLAAAAAHAAAGDSKIAASLAFTPEQPCAGQPVTMTASFRRSLPRGGSAAIPTSAFAVRHTQVCVGGAAAGEALHVRTLHC